MSGSGADSEPEAGAAPVFTTADVSLFATYPASVPWSEVNKSDDEHFRSIWARLGALANWMAEGFPGEAEMDSHRSGFQPFGRSVTDLWACIFPFGAEHVSFGVEVAIILSADGAELCFCLGAEKKGGGKDPTPEEEASLRRALRRLRHLPAQLREDLEAGLGAEWDYRARWRQPPGTSDFADLDAWLEHAVEAGGAGASISKNLSAAELESLGAGVAVELQTLAALVAPIIDFIYSAAVQTQWEGAAALAAGILADRPMFDKNERSFKLELVDRVQALYAAAVQGEPLVEPLKPVLADPPNHLVSWQTRDSFKKWAVDNGGALLDALSALGNEDRTLQERVDGFVSPIPHDVLDTPGARLSLATCLLMGLDFSAFPGYRPTVFEKTEKALGWPTPVTGKSDGAVYAEHLQFANLFYEELSDALDQTIDMLDAQSLLFCLAKYDDPQTKAWRHGLMPPSENPLAESVAAFRAEHPYSETEKTEKDETALALREEWRPALTADALSSADWETIEGLIGSIYYGNLGPAKSKPVGLIKDGTDEERDHLATEIRALLHGQAGMPERLRDFLAADLPGIKQTVAIKLLSLWSNDRVLPIFKVKGKNGKADLMALAPVSLKVPELDDAAELAIVTNDLIRDRLTPYFGDDTYGMSRYLYWLAEGDEAEEVERVEKDLDALSNRLCLDEGGWLEDAVDLLKRKQQLILYGPPGTGKTFIALELMKELAPDPEHREVVQFHPSYSYEDFVRGYRPVDNAGNLTYKVVDGPLVKLARKARASLEEGEDKPHILLIDEINRGNLPRILGELLYLLEYRGDEDGMQLMYGQEDEDRFTLPKNLWIIGTMNTADRSIGLIDAAMRRRFHFKPLFPGESPIKGTLRAWLKKQHLSEIADNAADLVDRLNDRLMEHQSAYGENLKVGHSYFMEKDLDPDLLSRIWASDVLPYLEEQLFGREEIDVKAVFSLESLDSSEGKSEGLTEESPPAAAPETEGETASDGSDGD